jgi:hypothetical protein
VVSVVLAAALVFSAPAIGVVGRRHASVKKRTSPSPASSQTASTGTAADTGNESSRAGPESQTRETTDGESSAPAGLFDDLAIIDAKIDALIADEKAKPLSHKDIRKHIVDINHAKGRMIHKFFKQDLYGIKARAVILKLDCLDRELSLALGFEAGATQGGQSAEADTVVRFLESGKDCKNALERHYDDLSSAQVPQGLEDALFNLDSSLESLISDEKSQSVGEELGRRIKEIAEAKSALVTQFFTQDIYGVKASEVILKLDGVDSSLALALGLSLQTVKAGPLTPDEIQFTLGITFALARRAKSDLEHDLRAASGGGANSQPQVSPISATFYNSGADGACDTGAHPNNGETCYVVSASDPDGDPLTYNWSLAPPVQDPSCKLRFTLTPPTKFVWHHGDPDGCNHTKEGPDGHVGAVFVTVKDGHFTCVAAYAGTNDPNTATKTGSAPQCSPDTQAVFTVVKMGIGAAGNSRTGPFGDGTVVSSPAGINCGPSCQSEAAAFPPEAKVTLTATADGNSTFVGWSDPMGVCSGTGACTVSTGLDRTVLATFQRK